jgi:DNA repair exonuclease SbcCD ATPase subunit
VKMKITELEIINIRGIKELTLHPDGNNFVVWGTNGTGKSAVVDAIDFLLTGQINRLIGTGTKGITLNRHGAHIDCEDLSQAYVKALISIDRISQAIEIRRSMDDPGVINCSEDYRDQIEQLEEIAHRGQHILTRREILRFVTATGGDRAKEIQVLMNLSEIDDIRKTMVAVKNKSKRDIKTAKGTLEKWETETAVRVGLDEYETAEVLRVVNEYRTRLKGKPVAELNEDTLQADIDPPKTSETAAGVNITIFENNITSLSALVSKDKQDEIHRADVQLRSLVDSIHEDANLLRSFSTQKLVQEGLEALDESGKCPLCDIPWEPGALETYLLEKLEDATGVQERIKTINSVANTINAEITKTLTIIANILQPIEMLNIDGVVEAFTTWQQESESLGKLLKNPVEKYHKTELSSEHVQRLCAPGNFNELLDQILEKAKVKFPKKTAEQTAWDILTELKVSVKHLREAQENLEKTRTTASRAESLHNIYIVARDEVLGGLYEEIKDRFVELHHADEEDFDATFELSEAALDFEVDFYGRGKHPPHALHSEGHQDSMGVCLFLALSEKLTQGVIDLIVLDDVVMSVDINHRRELCNILAKNFPENQFMITTHEKAWAMQLKFYGVVSSQNMYEFYDWHVETGPYITDAVDVWNQISHDMDKNDIPAAAARLRRGSEQFFAEVCDRLKAFVPFSLDGRYELGDLLTAAMSRFKGLLDEARKAAAS